MCQTRRLNKRVGHLYEVPSTVHLGFFTCEGGIRRLFRRSMEDTHCTAEYILLIKIYRTLYAHSDIWLIS